MQLPFDIKGHFGWVKELPRLRKLQLHLQLIVLYKHPLLARRDALDRVERVRSEGRGFFWDAPWLEVEMEAEQ
jgi:hypothetical protein